jgi:hypothetical protein
MSYTLENPTFETSVSKNVRGYLVFKPPIATTRDGIVEVHGTIDRRVGKFHITLVDAHNRHRNCPINTSIDGRNWAFTHEDWEFMLNNGFRTVEGIIWFLERCRFYCRHYHINLVPIFNFPLMPRDEIPLDAYSPPRITPQDVIFFPVKSPAKKAVKLRAIAPSFVSELDK